MSGEPVAIFLNVLNDEKKKKKHNKQTTTKEERKKLAEMNECYYLRENHEKELLLTQWICKYYDARPEYSHFIRRIIQSKVQAKRKEQQQQQQGKATEQNLLLLKTLNTLLCKKKIRGVHNRHATLPSQYNLCYFIENAEHNEYIPINLLDSYYRELRHYQTRYFDGFRDRQHRTSLARLNYWKWVNDIKLLERMSDIEQLIRRLEGPTTTTTSSKHTKQQKKRKRNENQVDEDKKREEPKKEIYLFLHPQYLTLPQAPTGLTRITLDPKLEERILLSCPLYATAPLMF